MYRLVWWVVLFGLGLWSSITENAVIYLVGSGFIIHYLLTYFFEWTWKHTLWYTLLMGCGWWYGVQSYEPSRDAHLTSFIDHQTQAITIKCIHKGFENNKSIYWIAEITSKETPWGNQPCLHKNRVVLKDDILGANNRGIAPGETWLFYLSHHSNQKVPDPRLDWIHAMGGERLINISQLPGIKLQADYGFKESLLKWLYGCRENARESMGQVFGSTYAPIYQALILGYKGDLTKDHKKIFRNTGTLHILAISGMHLMLIFQLLLKLLEKWPWIKSPWRRMGLGLVFVWLYAILVGLEPSVTRAAGMVTFIHFGKWKFRRKNLDWNMLAATAWMQLLMDPWVWNEAGFQLSYAAVIGIKLVTPVFNHVFPLVKWNPLQETIMVTLGATWFTFPILLYHFGSFPTLFLLANLAMIPFFNAWLVGGLLIWLTYSMGFHLEWAVNGLNAGLEMMLWLGNELARLQWTVIEEWYLPGALVMALIGLNIAYFEWAKFKIRQTCIL